MDYLVKQRRRNLHPTQGCQRENPKTRTRWVVTWFDRSTPVRDVEWVMPIDIEVRRDMAFKAYIDGELRPQTHSITTSGKH